MKIPVSKFPIAAGLFSLLVAASVSASAAEVSVSFSDPNISLNGTTSLCSNITPSTGTATGVNVSISLPAGLAITASPIGAPPATYNYGGGTYSITSSSIIYSGITISNSFGGCVTVTGLTSGTKVVTTTTVTSSNEPPGATKVASLNVIGNQATSVPVPLMDYPTLALLMLVIAFLAARSIGSKNGIS